MRRSFFGAFAIGVVGFGCAAGSEDTGGGGSGASTSASSNNQGGNFNTNGSGGSGGFGECATFSAAAEQAPAAMLIVLDKSASMNTNSKWATAQLAVVSAIDNDAFNSMSLGLVAFPASFTNPPDCLCEYACGTPCDALCTSLIGQVSCGVTALAQVALAPAGTEKSNQGGVRKSIYDYLAGQTPLSNADDGSPIYEAMNLGYQALKAYDTEKRILALITDGGFSCTSLSSRPGYFDGACNDWEYPDSVNQMIVQNRDDPTKPVNTFVIGLPGSDSTGQMQGSFATAPYAMKLALSTYAVNGSPNTVPQDCDQGAMFTQGGAAPAVPCHVDLTTGPFDGAVLADAIKQIRGQALGCEYDLPEPPAGEVINPSKVNVSLTLEGATSTLPKRSDPNDECTDDGCWDYLDDDTIVLVGKSCTDVTDAQMAQVDIVVGCDTLVK